MDNSKRQTTGGTPHWLHLLLGLSLAVNLLIAGVFIGGMIGNDTPPPPRNPGAGRFLRDLGLGPFIAAFPAETRRQMGRQLREKVGPLRADRAALLEELNDMLAILRTEPFDAAAFSAVIDQQRQRITTRAEAGRDVVIRAIVQMQPAQRAALADALAQSVRDAEEKAAARARR